jgi:hypothetical protein
MHLRGSRKVNSCEACCRYAQLTRHDRCIVSQLHNFNGHDIATIANAQSSAGAPHILPPEVDNMVAPRLEYMRAEAATGKASCLSW